MHKVHMSEVIHGMNLQLCSSEIRFVVATTWGKVTCKRCLAKRPRKRKGARG
jgi:hypothetical protein